MVATFDYFCKSYQLEKALGTRDDCKARELLVDVGEWLASNKEVIEARVKAVVLKQHVRNLKKILK